MSTPTTSTLHLSQPLTNISVAYIQSADNFVANRVFPMVPVEKEFDKYYTYDRASFIRNKMKLRGNGAESAGDGFKLSNDAYQCEVRALHKDVSDRDRKNADSVLALDRSVTEFLTMQGLISAEINWADNFFKSGVWGTDLTGIASGTPNSTQFLRWDNSASTPFIDVAKGKAAVLLASGGFEPNTLVLGYNVFVKLSNHPEVIDRVKSTISDNPGRNTMITVGPSELAQAFGISRVFVMRGVYNSAGEDLTATNAFIGGDHALLCYSAPSPGIMQVSAGYTFTWRGIGGNGAGVAMKKFRMENLESDRLEIQAAYDFKKVGADLGYMFVGAVS